MYACRIYFGWSLGADVSGRRMRKSSSTVSANISNARIGDSSSDILVGHLAPVTRASNTSHFPSVGGCILNILGYRDGR